MKEKNWKNSKLDGLCTEWYQNGQKKIKGIIKDGRRYGLCALWYENGQKEEVGRYKDGEKFGYQDDRLYKDGLVKTKSHNPEIPNSINNRLGSEPHFCGVLIFIELLFVN